MNEEQTFGQNLDPQQDVTTTKAGLKYGLYLGFVSIVLSLIFNLSNMQDSSLLSVLSLVIWVGFTIYAIRYFKSHNGGYMSFGQGVGIGTVVGAISSVISGIFSYFYLKFVDYSSINKSLNEMREEFERQGQMSDADIDKFMGYMEFVMQPEILLVLGIIFSVIFSLILSLILSAIMQKKKPIFED